MLTDEELTTLLAQSVQKAQATLNQVPVGVKLFCRVMWSTQHKNEHYLFVGTDPLQPTIVYGMNEHASKRVQELKATFPSWQALQTWHEQYAFVIQTDVRMVNNARQSGLVLVN